MTETKVLNTQTQVATEKTQKAKEILFSPVTTETESVATSGMEKFSTAYEADKMQQVLDKHDLKNYLNMQTTTTEQEQVQEIDESFKQLLENQTIKPVQTEQKVLSKPKIKADSQVNAKLNFRGKLMLTAFFAVSALFGFLAIFNAVDIKNINNEINSLTTEVSQSESQLGQLWQTYSELNNANRITNVVKEEGMSQISAGNQIATQLKIKEKQEVAKSSNWFDAFCDFLAGIFK